MIDFPVISTGCSTPNNCNIVGAKSPKFPPSRNSIPTLVTITGTGFDVWAVYAPPFSSSNFSAFPWSAVIIATPPLAMIASTTLPKHSSTASNALTVASNTVPVIVTK